MIDPSRIVFDISRIRRRGCPQKADQQQYQCGAMHEISHSLLSCCLPLLLIAPTASWFVMLFAPIGLVLSLPVSPMVVLGQNYFPNHVGLASGVTLGLALSFGGIMTPFLGMIADHYGLYTTISMLAVLPLICTCFTLALKNQRDIEAARTNS
jgi:hypothetical protein